MLLRAFNTRVSMLHCTSPPSYLASIAMTSHISHKAFQTAVGRWRITRNKLLSLPAQNLSAVEAAPFGTSPAAVPRGAEGSASRRFPSAPGSGRDARRGERRPQLPPVPGQRGHAADTSSAPDSPPRDGRGTLSTAASCPHSPAGQPRLRPTRCLQRV